MTGPVRVRRLVWERRMVDGEPVEVGVERAERVVSLSDLQRVLRAKKAESDRLCEAADGIGHVDGVVRELHRGEAFSDVASLLGIDLEEGKD